MSWHNEIPTAPPVAPPPVAPPPVAPPTSPRPSGLDVGGVGRPVGGDDLAADTSPSSPRPSPRAPTWIWIALAGLAVLSLVFATLYVTKGTDDRSSSDTSAEADNAPATGGQSPYGRSGTRVASGTYQIPDELGAGLYRVGISWFRYDSDGDLLDSSLTNDGPTLLLISDNAEPGSVQIIGGAWLAEDTGPIDPFAYIDGTFLVGVDIEPGTYRITAATRMADVAYGARLDDNLEIIVNDVSTDSETATSVTVEVMPTDFAFDFTGTIEKLD